MLTQSDEIGSYPHHESHGAPFPHYTPRGGINLMAQDPTQLLRSLEGHRVSVALADGSRLDDCQLISAPRLGLQTVWLLLADGADAFLPLAAVAEIWAVAAVAAGPSQAA